VGSCWWMFGGTIMRYVHLVCRGAANALCMFADLVILVQGGTIRGSINLPAQSFWYALQTLHRLCKAAEIKEVAFYCGTCRSSCKRPASLTSGRIIARQRRTMCSVVRRLPRR
jgi:hypothetical protein